jgi:nucleoside-diphosphate-sugar epimerase
LTTLVAGASGATGRWLVKHLLDRGQDVRAVVRTPEAMPDALKGHPRLSVVRGSILELDDAQLARLVEACTAIASCLGHTLNLKGIYGRPRRLVTDATRRLCTAVKAGHPDRPVRFVLMNTAGNRNRDIDEPLALKDRIVIGLVRLLLPPHADNEAAAEYLRTGIGPHDPVIKWVVVRPDTLIDADRVTAYEVHPSPTRSAVFDAGRTSRINVGHFMADLITDDAIWARWKGQMPVIYNEASQQIALKSSDADLETD